MTALDEQGYLYTLFAPIFADQTIHHIDGSAMAKRDVFVESARIARGNLKPLKDLSVSSFDAIVFPGFGAAKNLCDYAFSKNAKLNLEVKDV